MRNHIDVIRGMSDSDLLAYRSSHQHSLLTDVGKDRVWTKRMIRRFDDVIASRLPMA